ncbi:MAG: hypothetical protein Q9201_001276 [Fulgogasparrea decipioides]
MALCVAIGRLAVDMVSLHQYGAGRHFWDIPPEWYDGYLTAIAVDGYLYVIAITLAKMSLLLFLYRIFNVDKRFRIASRITGTGLTIWATVTVLLSIFSCRPVAASWNWKLRNDPKTVCEPKSYKVEKIYGFCNVITDAVLIAMPIPLIWNMQMDLKKKLGVAMVFATGALYALEDLHSSGDRKYIASSSDEATDPSWAIIKIKIWSKFPSGLMALEVNIAIIVACLPALSPLFKRIPFLTSLIPSYLRSGVSHASAMERAPWPPKLSGPQRRDVEQAGTPLASHAPHASWHAPEVRRDVERRQFGDNDSESERRSGETLRSIQATYHGEATSVRK